MATSKMLIYYIVSFFAFLGSTLADIALGSLSTSYTASSTITLQWVDDQSVPLDSDLSTATILLCTGPNAAPHCFSSNPVANKKSISAMDGEFKFAVSSIASLGSNGPYFLQFTAIVADSAAQYTIHYSTRFSLTGMTGSYAATDGGDVAPPSDEKHLTDTDPADAVATGDALSSSIALPYASQTGEIKYAPMQLQPGTTVTRQLTPSARYPTSAASIFSVFHSPAFQMSTATPSWSYTFSELTNYATPMPNPTRWYAASAVRASSIIARASAKRKRWMDV